jgi:cephalosporin hydroxylase
MAKQVSLSVLVISLAALNLYQFAVQSAPTRAVAATTIDTAAEAKQEAGQEGPSAKDREIADLYHQWFYDNPKITWLNMKWLGVTAQQNPNDVWIHQEIISEVKPDFIIEAGCWEGGSALLWATILQQVNPKGKVITMDIEDWTATAAKLPLWKERIEFMKTSSTDPKTVAELAKRVEGQKVLVILDSDHSKKHVLEELKAYSPMVSVGSYLIVQDTNINGHPVLKDFGPGPYEAVEEFLATNKQFQIDKSRERFLFTMHPNGYLKRVK